MLDSSGNCVINSGGGGEGGRKHGKSWCILVCQENILDCLMPLLSVASAFFCACVSGVLVPALHSLFSCLILSLWFLSHPPEWELHDVGISGMETQCSRNL